MLPNIVWKELWPVVGQWIYTIFDMSLKLSIVPAAWKVARILPLRKPNKPDYTVAKAYRPISLLPTLGKMLELVVARRLSYWAETWNLLPHTQFGARPRRSCEQALILLVEHIKDAWRKGNVLSLLSFDVKGAYNGVPKEVLLAKLESSGMPQAMVQWIRSFCSERKASIAVNGCETPAIAIDSPGLPQGSPLSPILYIFFNADLLGEELGKNEGAMGFVDDYTRWVVGRSIKENTAFLQRKVVPHTVRWARENGVAFEPDKTALIHFARGAKDTAHAVDPGQVLQIEGADVPPSPLVKILGVIFDEKLSFKDQVARAAKSAWESAQILARLKGVRPVTARQLYLAMVVPRIDYAAVVWYAQYLCRSMPI